MVGWLVINEFLKFGRKYCDLIEILHRKNPGGTKENYENSVTIGGFPDEIRTTNQQNIRKKCRHFYRLSLPWKNRFIICNTKWIHTVLWDIRFGVLQWDRRLVMDCVSVSPVSLVSSRSCFDSCKSTDWSDFFTFHLTTYGLQNVIKVKGSSTSIPSSFNL
jgi:hypothetical protein